MEKYKGSYLKWVFVDSTYWIWISIITFLLIGSYLQSKDLAMLFFLIPLAAIIIMSIVHYFQRRNGTSK